MNCTPDKERKDLIDLKKKLSTVTVLVCIALFIPLAVALIYGVNVDPNSVTANNLKQLSVSYGSLNFAFADDASFDLYSSITENAREIDSSFRDFAAEKPYSVTFTESNNTPITYTLYMTTNADDCVYVSPDGKYYMMSPEVAENLIVREEFSSLNDLKTLPVATVGGFGSGLTVQPDSYTWTYTALDGSMPTVTSENKASNPVVKFDGSDEGSLRINFDKKPDSLHLSITKSDGSIVFDDKYENLASSNRILYNSDTKLTLKAVAQWYEIDGAEYFGEASYTLDLLYDVAPTYKVVDAGGVSAGDFTVLRMSDFNDGELLGVESQTGLPEKIRAYDAGDGLKIAFLPMASTLKEGTYTLHLTTDSGHQTDVDVKIKSSQEFDSYTLIFTDEDLTKAFNEANITEFEKLTANLTAQSVNEHMYEGKFVYPTGSSKLAEGGADYGTNLEVISLYTKEYIHNGMQLQAAKGQDIKASNNGKVVFAGNTGLYGGTVVIDHGCGVLSYYGNLDSVSVSVGDSAVKGETVLGKAGSTGFACVKGGAEAKKATVTYFATSFGGIFIDPASPCRYGINF